MTQWRAVLVGTLIAVTIEMGMWVAYGRFTLFGGMAGSAVAGFMASGELPDGAWHGLLAALAWGIVFIPGSVVLAMTNQGALPFPFELIRSALGSSGAVTTALLIGITLPNALVGALGSAARETATRT
ncbi:MAG: DUF5518 domain-containing protein [Halobacteriota archaeon]